jgi:hypothetical protein
VLVPEGDSSKLFMAFNEAESNVAHGGHETASFADQRQAWVDDR